MTRLKNRMLKNVRGKNHQNIYILRYVYLMWVFNKTMNMSRSTGTNYAAPHNNVTQCHFGGFWYQAMWKIKGRKT